MRNISSPSSTVNQTSVFSVCILHMVNLRILGDAIVEEIERKGGKAFICNTPVVSDAETMVIYTNMHVIIF